MDVTVKTLARDNAPGGTEVLHGLLRLQAIKCPGTAAHAARCAQYARALAEQLRLPPDEIEAIRVAALLHDLGKIEIPDSILQKPGPLTEKEWQSMRQHPVLSHRALAQLGGFSDVLPLVRHHHERFDGCGYPDGLPGEDIPLGSRIILVIDAFDAMTTDRPYRQAMPIADAAKELVRCSGSQFDPRMVRAFLLILCGLGHSRPLVLTRPGAGPEGFSDNGDDGPLADTWAPQSAQVV
jgi:HD-GYP domain-containing protein (c-di-GMP phosphodiesterase class II)